MQTFPDIHYCPRAGDCTEAPALLVVHQGAIGDFILSLPALEALHRRFPQAGFIFVARPHIVQIIRRRPYFRAVLDCSSIRWVPLYQTGGRLASAVLQSLAPVESIFVFGRVSSQVLADNLGNNLSKAFFRLDPFPDPHLGLGVSEYQCRQLHKLGIPAIPPPVPVIAPSHHDVLEARGFLRRNLGPDRRLVLLHPGSGGRRKLWSSSGWLGLLHRLVGKPHLRPGLLQGPADADMVEALRAHFEDTSLIHVENWPLGQLAALISHAALFLGNDSGISHLAAACGIPTIVLFGPTGSRIWAPPGPRVTVIRWQDGHLKADASAATGETSRVPELDVIWHQVKRWVQTENLDDKN
ncbi:MAG: glycosyltransferase family 9 protein [Syntrophobacteria bacterium]